MFAIDGDVISFEGDFKEYIFLIGKIKQLFAVKISLHKEKKFNSLKIRVHDGDTVNTGKAKNYLTAYLCPQNTACQIFDFESVHDFLITRNIETIESYIGVYIQAVESSLFIYGVNKQIVSSAVSFFETLVYDLNNTTKNVSKPFSNSIKNVEKKEATDLRSPGKNVNGSAEAPTSVADSSCYIVPSEVLEETPKHTKNDTEHSVIEMMEIEYTEDKQNNACSGFREFFEVLDSPLDVEEIPVDQCKNKRKKKKKKKKVVQADVSMLDLTIPPVSSETDMQMTSLSPTMVQSVGYQSNPIITEPQPQCSKKKDILKVKSSAISENAHTQKKPTFRANIPSTDSPKVSLTHSQPKVPSCPLEGTIKNGINNIYNIKNVNVVATINHNDSQNNINLYHQKDNLSNYQKGHHSPNVNDNFVDLSDYTNYLSTDTGQGYNVAYRPYLLAPSFPPNDNYQQAIIDENVFGIELSKLSNSSKHKSQQATTKKFVSFGNELNKDSNHSSSCLTNKDSNHSSSCLTNKDSNHSSSCLTNKDSNNTVKLNTNSFFTSFYKYTNNSLKNLVGPLYNLSNHSKNFPNSLPPNLPLFLNPPNNLPLLPNPPSNLLSLPNPPNNHPKKPLNSPIDLLSNDSANNKNNADNYRPDKNQTTHANGFIYSGSEAPISESVKTHYNVHQSRKSNGNLRLIVIDGSNVAMHHGLNKLFSCKGIQLVVDYFVARGHEVVVFVPQWRRSPNNYNTPFRDLDILETLFSKGRLAFTPSRKVGRKVISSYDDRFILRLATDENGVVISNDQYQDLYVEECFKDTITTRILQVTFIGDKVMFPDDPLGRGGPTLDQFLTKTHEIQIQNHRNRSRSMNYRRL